MKYSVQDYIKIAESTKAFTSPEIKTLREVLEEWEANPGKDYLLLHEEDQEGLMGFLIYGSTPMTESGFDLYWIAVKTTGQRKGMGRKLVLEMENRILEEKGRGVIRIETSGREQYKGQRQFYLSLGYSECGRIRNFYHQGDDLVTFSKSIQGMD